MYDSLWPCDPQHTRPPCLSITNSRILLKLTSIELVMPSSHLILCCPLLFLPPIPPSIRVFSKESVLQIRWSKYWNLSFNISPSNEYSACTCFKDSYQPQNVFQLNLTNKNWKILCGIGFYLSSTYCYLTDELK